MTSERAEFTEDERKRLVDCYTSLQSLEGSGIPSVRAAVRAALAELRVAMYAQLADFEYYVMEETDRQPETVRS